MVPSSHGSRVLALLLLAATLHGPLGAQGDGAPPPVPLERRGPALGSVAPEFRLRDQSDVEQTLTTLSGKAGLVLLFVRSADW